MPGKYTDEYFPGYARAKWNGVADPGLGFMSRLRPLHRELARQLGPCPGEPVVDPATGPGEPALSVAELAGDRRKGVGVDLSERMTDRARRAATAKGVTNVEFRVVNCEPLERPSASVDAGESALSLRMFTNPGKAAVEAYRAVKPGGRVACCIWSTGYTVPYIPAAIGPTLAHAGPDETGYFPTPYEIEWVESWFSASKSPGSRMPTSPG